MLVYRVEEALYNKAYRSKRGEGTIQEAHKRSDVFVDSGDVYAVRVRPTYHPERPSTWGSDFWATIVVESE